ncbi:hypothetical protein K488DRAFT_88531 [Vararia minispora EC-137]|uniref:Uncharacterized protein n=1 Tax=Vararia minispora EC-137 TaxID=1314806 RepID=A0ACB8QD08_9AGAM|nr:hypothetical protein K488DRAFT_88531 [Vararia minispora EC-137]
MLFASLSLVALAAFANAAAVDVAKRQAASGAFCYAGVHEIEYNDQYGALELATTCEALMGTDRSTMWSHRRCVAAAVAGTPNVFIDFANCGNNITIPLEKDFPSLDYNVYASIVGNCAWAQGGCPITQQNFVDLVYSELAATGSNIWPTSAQVLINDRIAPIFTWTNFTVAEGVPYLNFNDYLHYS